MVQAILDGRKTMTRRVVKPQPAWIGEPNVPFKTPDADPKGIIKCPYQPGDRLWVRETWAGLPQFHNLNSEIERYIYKADEDATPLKWKPSIHMPKEAARIWLEVTSVRVERLQDITEEDAKAEGIAWERARKINRLENSGRIIDSAKAMFMRLWDSINAKRGYGWDINPWVWVIEFKKVSPCPPSPQEKPS